MSRVVLLTGATSGLGRALVNRFASAGHTVLGCGRDREALEDLTANFGAPHDFCAVNVADESQVRSWAERALPTPDLVLNNAGVINQPAPLWQVPAAEFDALIDINVKGTANVIRHFLPAMLEAGRGVIVNFSSGWGRSTAPEVAPYCASKWAIEGLSQALAQELPAGLASIALNPGIINTPMLQTCFGESASHYPDAERWSKGAAEFLLSLGASHNGRALSVS